MLTEEAKEKAKESRKRYDKEHMRIITFKTKIEDADAFAAYCEAKGKTVSGTLRGWMKLAVDGKLKIDKEAQYVPNPYDDDKTLAAKIEKMNAAHEKARRARLEADRATDRAKVLNDKAEKIEDWAKGFETF